MERYFILDHLLIHPSGNVKMVNLVIRNDAFQHFNLPFQITQGKR